MQRMGKAITELTQQRRDQLVALAEEGRQPFDPEVALFVDDSEESQEARRLLDRAGEPYRLLIGNGTDIPAAVFGGVVAERLAGVRGLLRAIASFDATFTRARAQATVATSHSAPRLH
jgi:hypothetical protein